MRVTSGLDMLSIVRNKGYKLGTIAHGLEGRYWVKVPSGWMCARSAVIHSVPCGYITMIEEP